MDIKMTKARDMGLNGSFTRGREKQETKSPFTIPEFAPIVVDHLVSRKTIRYKFAEEAIMIG